MTEADRLNTPTPPPLLAAGGEMLAANMAEVGSEEVWIDVIRQMDTVYADLVASQTALEQQHSQLAEAHDLINSVLDSMTDVLVAAGPDGRIQRVNKVMVGVVGAEAADLVGKPIEDLFAEEERTAIRKALIEVRAGRSIDQREWHLVMRDGSLATFSTNIAPRQDGAGKYAGPVLVGRSLGELQRAYGKLDEAHQKLQKTQEQLLLSEKMAALGRLVAGVAHELNNPISFVFGNMYSLKRYGSALSRYLEAQDSGVSGGELRELRQELRIDRILDDIGPLVDGTLEGAERVRDIVQELRRFSSGQQEHPEPMNLSRLIATAAEWVAKAQRRTPEVKLDMPDRLEMTTLKGPLHQIIVNLLQNASDAVNDQDDGAIHVSATQNGGEVELVVADNGPGISEDARDKIFEPFFTTKPIGTGTGLGLYVSYSMAGRLGGRLSFADNPGGGARFTLRLPANLPEAMG